MCRKGLEKLTYMILDIQKIMKEKKNREQRDSVQKTMSEKKEKCLSDMSREKGVLLQWYMIIEYVYSWHFTVM